MRKKRTRKILLGMALMIGVLGTTYLGGVVYFTEHFYPNTVINGTDMSWKTKEDAEAVARQQVEEYRLSVLNKDETVDFIEGRDIGLVYKENQDIGNLLETQMPLLWAAKITQGTSTEIRHEVEYDSARLSEAVNQLNCVTGETVPPENAKPEFDGKKYVIKAEVSGSGVKKDELIEKLGAAVQIMQEKFDIEAENCYVEAEYTKDSPEVKAACDLMNHYAATAITYPMDVPVIVDATVVSQWLSVNEKMEVTLNEDGIRQWLTQFGEKYDTLGATRNFTTPNGKAASVTGGTYGWSINEDAEYVYLLDAVKNGKTETRNPECYAGGTAAVHTVPDWGATYLEVDLSQQYMWYVVNNVVALESNVVTGEPIPSKITPEGVYTILEMLRDTKLVGNIMPDTGKPEYISPVSYWMRVTYSGIGFHDAIWQSAFGGSLNQIPGIGSHGCINMPLRKAGELFDMLEIGTPVVIHY